MSTKKIDRRTFLAGSTALAGAAMLPGAARASRCPTLGSVHGYDARAGRTRLYATALAAGYWPLGVVGGTKQRAGDRDGQTPGSVAGSASARRGLHHCPGIGWAGAPAGGERVGSPRQRSGSVVSTAAPWRGPRVAGASIPVARSLCAPLGRGHTPPGGREALSKRQR